jgi:hypothetical protein
MAPDSGPPILQEQEQRDLTHLRRRRLPIAAILALLAGIGVFALIRHNSSVSAESKRSQASPTSRNGSRRPQPTRPSRLWRSHRINIRPALWTT